MKITKQQAVIVALLLIVLITQIVLLMSPKNEGGKYPEIIENTITERIESKQQDINHYTTQVVDYKKLAQEVADRMKITEENLHKAKEEGDTNNVIKYQDTLIYELKEEVDNLKIVIMYQDSTIVAQKDIIEDKDLIINLKEEQIKILSQDVKKVKRQRNGSLILNGVLTGVLIYKFVK